MSHSSLRPVRQSGWRLGFFQLLAKESRRWWGSRRWLVQSLVWLTILNGMLAFTLFVLPRLVTDPSDAAELGDPVLMGMQTFFGMGASVAAIGVIVLMLDEIIGEVQSGTAAWLLSKPVSRSGLFLAKLLAHGAAVLLILVALQAAVAYAQFALYGAAADVDLLHFLGAVALLGLHTCFYLALTLMMGVLVPSRGPVLAVPIAMVLGGKLLAGIAEPLGRFTPWLLPDLLPAVAGGSPLPDGLIVEIAVSTAVLCAAFVGVALIVFRRTEF